MTLDAAKRLAADWEEQRKDHDREAALVARFRDAKPMDVIKMGESGRNERGQKLSQFEVQALGERWVGLFRDLPPAVNDGDEGNGSGDQSTASEVEPAGDTMLDMRDVTRLTCLSKEHHQAPGGDDEGSLLPMSRPTRCSD